jgi:hypothetical protein
MHPLGQDLAEGTSGFGKFQVGLNRDRFGMHFHLIQAHSGEVKQDREGYHHW